MTTNRGRFSSRLGFIAAAAGSAVGLGNIWRFPYETGANGGAVFLILFILCAFLICFPIMLAEIAMGRKTEKNAYGAFTALGGKKWGIVGLFGILCGFMILSFYNVVAGWAFGYFIHISTGDFDIANDFVGYTQNFRDNLFYSLTFMGLTAFIVAAGVKAGIERMAKILMPALIIILLFLIIYALTLEGAYKGVAFYLIPDFSAVNISTIYSALSQAFFSLSLGMGALITYGSYLRKNDNIVSSASMVTFTDVGIAFLAGMMIFPFVFSQGIEPQAGPGLVFITLPGIFETMGPLLSKIIGGSFFLLLCFAALTSTISLLEVPTAYLVDEKKWKRVNAVSVLAIGIFLTGLASMFSTGAKQWATEFIYYGGEYHSFFDFIDDVFSNIGLPLGGLLLSIFTAWVWKTKNLSEELSKGNSKFKNSFLEKFVTIMLCFFCPVLIGFVFVVTVLQKFFSISIF